MTEFFATLNPLWVLSPLVFAAVFTLINRRGGLGKLAFLTVVTLSVGWWGGQFLNAIFYLVVAGLLGVGVAFCLRFQDQGRARRSHGNRHHWNGEEK